MADILTKRYWDKKPPLGSQIDWSHPLSKGLVGCWLMNEGGGTKIYDISGYKNTGTFSGGTQWGISKKGYIVNTNFGNSPYVSCGNNPSVRIVGKISIVVWINMTYFSPEPSIQTMVEKGYDGGSEGYFLRISNNSSTHILQFGSYEGQNYMSSYNVPWGLNEWHQVVGLWNGTAMQLYIDSIQVNTTNTTQGALATSKSLFIGVSDILGSLDRWFYSSLANVLLYNRALSPSEIQSLYIAPFQMIKPRRIVFGYGAEEPEPPPATVTPYGYLSCNKGYW